jgi:hypothetical protein
MNKIPSIPPRISVLSSRVSRCRIRSGARAARATFRLRSLQVRVLAAGEGGLIALANRARRLRLGKPFTIAARIEAFYFRGFAGERWLARGHAPRTSGAGPRLPRLTAYGVPESLTTGCHPSNNRPSKEITPGSASVACFR